MSRQPKFKVGDIVVDDVLEMPGEIIDIVRSGTSIAYSLRTPQDRHMVIHEDHIQAPPVADIDRLRTIINRGKPLVQYLPEVGDVNVQWII